METSKSIYQDKVLYTPVLLLAFNRPEKTARVFESIRQVKPTKLYVAVDAPREGRFDDVEKNKRVKEIVQNVDWPCETHYLFHEKNLGCSLSGVTAWNWIFETEDRMIFLEDDGLGTKSAFFFIQDMLEKYKDDSRIAYVGAVNFGPKYGDASYFFSRFPDSTYFMGTWKRVNNLYDFNLDTYSTKSKEKTFNQSFITQQEKYIRKEQFKAYRQSVKRGSRSNSYDIQMLFLAHANNMYSIYPNVNMVTNIGFDDEGTNFSGVANSSFLKEYGARKAYEMDDIKYLDDVTVEPSFEKEFFKKRALFNKPWGLVWGKAWFLNHFGGFYKKWIKPIRRR